LINNQGIGTGGFLFINTPSSGAPLNPLMILNGSGNLGIGTTSPISRLTLSGVNTTNPNNSGSSIDYNGQGLTFVNSAPTGNFTLGGIRIVQRNGYYLDNGDMIFTVGRTNGATLDAATIQGASGYFGIATATPTAPLEVNGSVKLTWGSGASMTYSDGSIQSTAWTGVLSGGDYAESVNVSGDRNAYEPGDVLIIDSASEGKFLKSSKPYASTVSGIYSTNPGVTGRRQQTSAEHMREEVPMAMTGIVPIKVCAENGPIKVGDLLVTSSRPGFAMKGTDRSQMLGAVIGKAIGHLDSGTGIIEAVVSLQ